MTPCCKSVVMHDMRPRRCVRMEPISWDADDTLVDIYRARVLIVILFTEASNVADSTSSGYGPISASHCVGFLESRIT